MHLRQSITNHRNQIITVAILGIIFGLVIKPVMDPDMWWHLATGKLIWQTKSIPQTDQFIYSIVHYPYVYHSWLSYLILYISYLIMGLWGGTILYSLTFTISCFIIYKTAFRTFSLLGYLTLVPLAAILIFTVTLRPQAYSLLGICLVWYLISPLIQNPTSSASFFSWLKIHRLYWLYPLFLLWVNLHGGYIWGLMLIVSVGLVIFYSHRELTFLRNASILIFTLGLISFLNPYTYRVYEMAFQMGTNTQALMQNIDWFPLYSLELIRFEPGIVIVQIAVTLFMINYFFLRIRWEYKIIAGIFYVLSIYTHRFLLVLYVVIFPDLILFWVATLKRNLASFTTAIKAFRYFLLMIPVIIGYLIIYNLTTTIRVYEHPDQFGIDLPLNLFPYEMIPYFQKNGIPTRLLNDYNYGGYLEWYFPNSRFFIDGRMDNFFIDGKSFLEIYSPLVHAQEGWQNIMHQYQFNGVLLSPEHPLVEALLDDTNWQLIQTTDRFAFFLPQ